MRVLVCGDRYWSDADLILARLAQFNPGDVVIHGGANGADTIAGMCAQKLGHNVEVFRADWNTYGRAAGPIRNRVMLDTKPDLVIAFHDCIAASKGTRDCTTEAKKRGISVELIAHTP